MRFSEELITRELTAAARAFGGEPWDGDWKEAFEADPDRPPLSEFQAKYLNDRSHMEGAPALLDEVEHERATSVALSDVNQELRSSQHSWENVAQANLESQISYFLGPICDPEFPRKAAQRQTQLVDAWQRDPSNMEAGSPATRFVRYAQVASAAKNLRQRYASVAEDPAGFCASDAVSYLPVIRLFAFLLAALSIDGRRTTPQPGDLHDLWHLTYGLSRCDVVSADRRSCEIARGRNLIPEGVDLVEATQLDQIADAVLVRLRDGSAR